MELIELSNSEKLLLKRDLEFPWIQLFLFVFSIAIGAIFIYLIVIWGERKIISVFSDFMTLCPGLDEEVKKVFETVCRFSFRPAIYFLAVFICMGLVFFLSHFKRASLLKKLKIDSLI